MADVQTYIGGNGNWGVAANWAGDGGAKVPVTTDTAIIPSTTTVNITAGLDQGGVKLAALIVAKGSVVEIGSSGGPLLIAAGLVHVMGRAGFYMDHAQDAGATLDTDLVIIEPSLPTAIVHLGSEESDDLGMPDILINSGRVTIKANMGDITRLDVRYRTNRGGDADVKIEAAGTPGDGTIATVYGAAGFIEAHKIITNLVLSNGCQHTQETALVTNAFIGEGAGLVYNDDGTITLVRAYSGGTFDLVQRGQKVTVTTGIWNPGSTIRKDPTLHTITNEYDLRNI